MKYKTRVSQLIESSAQMVDGIKHGIETRTVSEADILNILTNISRQLESADNLIDLETGD